MGLWEISNIREDLDGNNNDGPTEDERKKYGNRQYKEHDKDDTHHHIQYIKHRNAWFIADLALFDAQEQAREQVTEEKQKFNLVAFGKFMLHHHQWVKPNAKAAARKLQRTVCR